ncbi:MAG: amidoligase family protein, partial [Pseudomonadota bacterium]
DVTSLAGISRALGRSVIPVEVVTPPLEPVALEIVDDMTADLVASGAKGTEAGLMFGFGMHINVEIRSQDPADIVPVLRAFAFLEDWLRGTDPIDTSRRILPFVDPYPRGFVTDVAERGADWDMDTLFELYFRHNRTRNRALDMLPILRTLDPERVDKTLGTDIKIGTRPTYHYRLPDCRLDDPGWSVVYEWNRWVLVEQVARDPELLEHLAERWLAYRNDLTSIRGDWRQWVDTELVERGLWRWGGRA